MPKRDDVYAKAVWRMEFQARRQNITLHDIDKKHELFHRAYLQYGILTENNRYLRARWKSFLETGSRAAKSAGRPKKAPKPAKPSKPRDDSEWWATSSDPGDNRVPGLPLTGKELRKLGSPHPTAKHINRSAVFDFANEEHNKRLEGEFRMTSLKDGAKRRSRGAKLLEVNEVSSMDDLAQLKDRKFEETSTKKKADRAKASEKTTAHQRRLTLYKELKIEHAKHATRMIVQTFEEDARNVSGPFCYCQSTTDHSDLI